ncbi:uncharacterized protein LOC126672933 [Mercurialis annua]|uniref:uncharacterized protein LOC126672933 n=1 Tax=Mercurialis annua TaxID=3986 RepID=UPI0021608BA5|nr:uncharacterized protein LOC126672933 [Mercurialis annua]
MVIHHSIDGSLFSSPTNPNEQNNAQEVEDYELLREIIMDQKYDIYMEQVKASGGFDVDSIFDSDLVGEIAPLLRVGEEPDDDIKLMVDFAIAQHNKEECSNLQLVKIVKTNFAFVSGVMFYITLDAKDDEKKIGTYQAQVFDGIIERKLMLFRPLSISSNNISDEAGDG